MLRKILISILLFALLFGNLFAPPKTVAGEVLGYGIGKLVKGSVIDDIAKQTDEAPKPKPDTSEVKLDPDSCPISQKPNWWWEVRVLAISCPTYKNGSEFERDNPFEAAIKRENFNSEANKIREKYGANILDSSGKPKSNIAIAEIDIKTLPNTKKLLAIADNDLVKNSPDFIKDLENSSFKTEGGGRIYDTEYKILTNLDNQLAGNLNANGVINLFSERVICTSCSSVIDQFKAKYPKIVINIVQRD